MLAARTSAFVGNALTSRPLVSVCPRRAFVVENAQKKGGGSTKNGRDSEAKRRGVKVYGGQPVKAGGIIIRQVGSQWHAGSNVDTGKDFTIYSLIDGIVYFDKKKIDPCIHVFPLDHPKSQAAVKATHTTAPKEGGNRAARRRAQYTSRKAATPAVEAPAQ